MIALTTAVSVLSGCNDSGDKFVGHWIEITKNINGKGDKLDISCSGNNCHMVTESYDSISGWDKNESDGKVSDENTLVFGGGLEVWKIDSDGLLHQGNAEYKKN